MVKHTADDCVVPRKCSGAQSLHPSAVLRLKGALSINALRINLALADIRMFCGRPSVPTYTQIAVGMTKSSGHRFSTLRTVSGQLWNFAQSIKSKRVDSSFSCTSAMLMTAAEAA